MPILSPSMLAADFGNLERDTKLIDRSAAQWIHIDVMDGCFVPNISYGFPVLETIRRHSSKVMDVHLMIVEPERYVARFVEAGADIVTFHLEATDKARECIAEIRKMGACAGVSIKPATPVSDLREIIEEVDLVLLMSVEPGFGGQSFIAESVERVAELKAMLDGIYWGDRAKPLIEVDGGISAKNAPEIFAAGADAVVAGSSIFRAQNPEAEIEKILGL
ncbi:MAG: ribulose-phosphate 3-epimerase [Rikenellaceae bacterium]